MRQGIVNTNLLNFRETPGGIVIDILDAGETMEVLRSAGSWLQVKIETAIGYVASRYVRMLPEIQTPQPQVDLEAPNIIRNDIRFGTITADRLNFRDSPNGHILKVIPKGSTVEILRQSGSWLEANFQGRNGYLSANYVRVDFKPTVSIPSPAAIEPGGFQFDGNKVVAPNGAVFGRKFRKGLYNYGSTSISEFISRSSDQINNISPSRLRVMDAVSENEGKFEAVNTWDNAFLSIGLFQWTAGVGADAGELASLLHRFKIDYPQSFEEFFGRFGLAPSNVSQLSGNVGRGYLSLNGVVLINGSRKETLRRPFWAHQCWLAGQNQNFQITQLVHAVSRIDAFYSQDKKRIRGRWVSDYVSSEYGVAQLLDQHVNRPAHVPLTLSKAVEDLSNRLDIDHPENWGDNEEQLLIDHYLKLRERTSMTDSNKRAELIQNKIAAGRVSNKRNSFI